jgi:ubiquinone/menaquinone biosynthesis C-methylase UbiE
MSDETISTKNVGEAFSKDWWSDKFSSPREIYDDLVAKIKDRNYKAKCTPPEIVNRSSLACGYVINNVPKGGRVLDMACGLGFDTCCLRTYGYQAKGFDLSETAIERSKLLANSLGQDPEMFSVADVSCLSDMPDESFEAVLAIGLFRYLDKDTQDACYRNVHRILKPEGKFLVVHQNILFETFALNDGTLRFWADVIERYSNAPRMLLNGKSVFEVLSENIKVPLRKYKPHSISRRMKTYTENPLTYSKVAEGYNFKLEKMVFPPSHLMPPFLEEQVDQRMMDELRRTMSFDHINDWQAMFVEIEFLAFLAKQPA